MPGTLNRPDVTTVIVTYNSSRTILRCLESLPDDVSVIVVDNASTDDTCALVDAAHRKTTVIRNDMNQGYGHANNQGMAEVKTKYGLILNPDALVDASALDALLAAADRNPEAATIAPLLLRPNGGLELPLMGAWEKNHVPATITPEGDFCTWFLTGAALLWRMDAWRSVGGFDEAIFLYNEDADLALRTKEHGLAQIVTTGARVPHIGGGSVPRSTRVRWIKDWHMTWSHFYYERKYGGDRHALHSKALKFGIRSLLRALLYVVLLNPQKVVGNAAKASGALSYIMGRDGRGSKLR